MTGRRILFTNVHLENYAGTECVVRDLAVGMLRRGHRPVVYSPKLGAVADEIRARGIPVVDDLRLVGERPDVIHGHHYIQTAEAVIRYPDVPALSMCHAWVHWVESAPRFPQIRRYGAVSSATRDRLVVESGIPPETVTVFPNAVDLDRFPARSEPLPGRPSRLLSFGRHRAHLPVLRAVAAHLGAELDVLDGSGVGATADPGERLRAADLVFATGRSALEALASGCAVVVGDSTGLGGLVTTADLAEMRAANFALRLLGTPFTEDAVLAEIARFSADDAARVSAAVRDEASLERQLDTFEAVYDTILAEAHAAPCDPAEQHAALTDFLTEALPRRWPDRRWPWQAEKDALLAERDRLLAANDDLRTRLARQARRRRALRRELDALRASRSWRLTAPLRRGRDG